MFHEFGEGAVDRLDVPQRVSKRLVQDAAATPGNGGRLASIAGGGGRVRLIGRSIFSVVNRRLRRRSSKPSSRQAAVRLKLQRLSASKMVRRSTAAKFNSDGWRARKPPVAK